MSRYDLPNPFFFLPCDAAGNAAPAVFGSLPSGESGPSVMTPRAGAAPTYPCCVDCGAREPCDRHCPHGRFQLDEAALMSDIEPVPAFLTRPVDEYIPVSAQQADQIEEMLKLARAEEWPAPPRRMVG